jgi:hypothetical protein
LGVRVDALINQRWQAGLSPFAGDCLITDDLVSVEDLRTLLAVILAELKDEYATQTLYTFDDWHQHDGYITERRATDWGSLTTLAQCAHALIASRQGDSYVHRSFYPEDLSFLLRYDVAEAYGDGAGFSGAFDLSANPPSIARILSLVPPTLRPRLRVEPSKGYFDRTYAG